MPSENTKQISQAWATTTSELWCIKVFIFDIYQSLQQQRYKLTANVSMPTRLTVLQWIMGILLKVLVSPELACKSDPVVSDNNTTNNSLWSSSQQKQGKTTRQEGTTECCRSLSRERKWCHSTLLSHNQRRLQASSLQCWFWNTHSIWQIMDPPSLRLYLFIAVVLYALHKVF